MPNYTETNSTSTSPNPRLTKLTVEQVVHVPEVMLLGVIYVSKRFETCLHLCPCGCGEKVVTPQHPTTGWVLTGTDDCVTLHPSIANPWCRSHYFVVNNVIDWL